MSDETRPDREALAMQRLTNAIRDHFDRATGGQDPSITGYVERLRLDHQAYMRRDGGYGGCTCGTPLCPTAVLIAHIDNLTAAFEQERAKFATETLRKDTLPAPHPQGGTLPENLRGDGPCSRCGSADNPVWFTESVFWNSVVRSAPLPWCEGDGFMCVNCFVRLADERGYRPIGWRLLPEWHWETHNEHRRRALLAAAPAPTEAGEGE